MAWIQTKQPSVTGYFTIDALMADARFCLDLNASINGSEGPKVRLDKAVETVAQIYLSGDFTIPDQLMEQLGGFEKVKARLQRIGNAFYGIEFDGTPAPEEMVKRFYDLEDGPGEIERWLNPAVGAHLEAHSVTYNPQVMKAAHDLIFGVVESMQLEQDPRKLSAYFYLGTLGNIVDTGLPLDRAVQMTPQFEDSGSVFPRTQVFEDIRAHPYEFADIALDNPHSFPEPVGRLIATGMEGGILDSTLKRAADYVLKMP